MLAALEGPSIAIRLLKQLRDFAQVEGDGTITNAIAEYSLQALQVDERGLDGVDLRIMAAMADMFGGGPVGLETLAASTGEDTSTIEDVYEPFLMRIGFLMKTPRGRVLTPAGWQHLGKVPPDDYDHKLGISDQQRRQLSFQDFATEAEQEWDDD